MNKIGSVNSHFVNPPKGHTPKRGTDSLPKECSKKEGENDNDPGQGVGKPSEDELKKTERDKKNGRLPCVKTYIIIFLFQNEHDDTYPGREKERRKCVYQAPSI